MTSGEFFRADGREAISSPAKTERSRRKDESYPPLFLQGSEIIFTFAHYAKRQDNVRLRKLRAGNCEVGGQMSRLRTMEHNEGVPGERHGGIQSPERKAQNGARR